MKAGYVKMVLRSTAADWRQLSKKALCSRASRWSVCRQRAQFVCLSLLINACLVPVVYFIHLEEKLNYTLNRRRLGAMILYQAGCRKRIARLLLLTPGTLACPC